LKSGWPFFSLSLFVVAVLVILFFLIALFSPPSTFLQEDVVTMGSDADHVREDFFGGVEEGHEKREEEDRRTASRVTKE
jgi:hypothetical protein